MVYGILLYECVIIYPVPFWTIRSCEFFASINSEAARVLAHHIVHSSDYTLSVSF